MAAKARGGEGKPNGLRIHPSPYVLAQLQQLADKGQLAQTVPEVARILLGERLMQLEKEGLVQAPRNE